MTVRGVAAAAALCWAMGCSSDDPEVGFLRKPCYPNGTCNVSLVCVDGLCLESSVGSSSGSDDGAPIGAGASSSGPGFGPGTGGYAGSAPGGAGGAGSAGGAITGGDGGVLIGGFGGLPLTGGSGGSPPMSCLGITYQADVFPLDLYLMVDRSSSMQEPVSGGTGSKWQGLVTAIEAFVTSGTSLTDTTRVALQYFGLADACDVAGYASPEVPLGSVPDVSGAIVGSLGETVPTTLTPTAPAVEGGLEYMSAQVTAERQAAVVLLTDGFPTQCGVSCTTSADCLGGGTCDTGMCSPNSIAEIEALAARYAAASPRVLTFVVGIAAGFENIHAIALGGGTREAYLIASGDVASQVEQALRSIANSPLSCAFSLPEAESPADLDRVNLVVRRSPTDEETLARVFGSGDCALAGGGWYYDDPTSLTPAIYLCPESCATIGAATVDIVFGCASKVAVPR